MYCVSTRFRIRERGRRLLPWRALCVLMLSLTIVVSAPTQEPFTISTSYQNLLSNSDKTGLLDRVFTELFDRLGVEMEIVFSPTARSLVDVNAGIIDAEANRIAGMEAEYPNLRRVPEPNMTMEFVAFAKHEHQIDGWDSIRELDIGIVRGWRILEENTSGFPYVVTVPTEVELFTMLDRGRIDIALYARLTGYSCLAEMDLEGITHLEPPLATRDMYLYVHEKHADLTDDIARVLREMKDDGTYQAIRDSVMAQYSMGDD
ncbi:MAG: substrate-binding periplasmic protein [Spirochaetota bacterium]